MSSDTQHKQAGSTKVAVVVVVFLLLVCAVVAFYVGANRKTNSNASSTNKDDTTLNALPSGDIDFGTRSLTVGGQLTIGGSLLLTPQMQPSQAAAGQLYFDKAAGQLAYYNGTNFVMLGGTSVASLTAGSSNLKITDDGSGNLTITSTATGSSTTVINNTTTTSSSDVAFVQGGNSLGTTATLGTNDNNSLNVRTNGTTRLTLAASNGAATFQNSADSTVAFRVLNAGSVPLFVIDTSDARVYVGNPTGDTVGALLVLDSKTDYTNGPNSSSEPTGVAGAMYYNSSLGQYRCYDLGYWHDCSTETLRTSYHYYNDFIGSAVDSSLDYFASAGGFSSRNAVTRHPGILSMDTGGSSTSVLWLVPRSSSSKVVLFGGGDSWQYESVTRIPSSGSALSTGSERYTYRVGFIDDGTSNNGDGTNGCFFRYSDNINSGKWQGVCRDNATESVCDTTITVATDTWYRLTTVVNAAGDSVDYQINGASRCTVTTNIPTATGRETNWGTVLKKNAGTTSRTVDVDYIDILGQFGSSR